MTLVIPVWALIQTIGLGAILIFCGYRLGVIRSDNEYRMFIDEMTEAKAFLPTVARDYLIKKFQLEGKIE